jgi:hypothetical protein
VVLQKTLFKDFHFLKELQEFNDLYPLTDIIRVIKSRRTSWGGYGFWRGNLREREHLDDPGVDGRIILKCFFRKCDGAWTELIWLRIGTCGGFL